MSFDARQLDAAAKWLALLINKIPEHMSADDWVSAVCRANRLSDQGSIAYHFAAALREYGAACAAAKEPPYDDPQ
jgi:hypothetical protein